MWFEKSQTLCTSISKCDYWLTDTICSFFFFFLIFQKGGYQEIHIWAPPFCNSFKMFFFFSKIIRIISISLQDGTWPVHPVFVEIKKKTTKGSNNSINLYLETH